MRAKNQRTRPTALATALAALLLPCGALAQDVESVFLSAPDGEGYYVVHGGVAKLEVAALANLRGERPVSLGARLELKKRYFGEQTVRFEDTAALTREGRRDSSGRDRWYLPGFFWQVACSVDGRSVSVNGVRVGKSPVDLIIQLGIAEEPEEVDDAEGPALKLRADTIAESRKTRIVCGKYAPLPSL